MEQLIAEIEDYAARMGISPQAVLRRALGSSGRTWGEWVRRESSPTMANVDRLRDWIRDNPPEVTTPETDAA